METNRKAYIKLTKNEWETISDFLGCFFNYDGEDHGIIDTSSVQMMRILRKCYMNNGYDSNIISITIEE